MATKRAKWIAVCVGIGGLCIVLITGATVIRVAWRGGGAASDYRYEFAPGYCLARTNASSCFILADGRNVVPPNIQRARFVDDLVVGYAEESEAAESVRGYFVLDLAAGDSAYGLSKVEWLDKLESRGIQEPVLVLPERAWKQREHR